MRVISLVPSITETLIECGVTVVGRTRFCIHPADRVTDIRVIGGTKGVNWAKCADLAADLVIFDQEENREEMADSCPFNWMAIHICSVRDLPAALTRLAERLDNHNLSQLAQEWQQALVGCAEQEPQAIDWNKVPAQIMPVRAQRDQYKRIEYVIWRDPWMTISRNTFVGSMLECMGFSGLVPDRNDKYPVLDEAAMQRSDTFYLFSSEPYRFARYAEDLKALNVDGAIVDGEVFSWFGLRSLRALQNHQRATGAVATARGAIH
jgi:ABC-type Fe3+-hydroxamate transport system substrate-binding protein